MGFGSKGHRKKTDKETQSKTLRIFTQIMENEKQEPEKISICKHELHFKKKLARGKVDRMRSNDPARSSDLTRFDQAQSSDQARSINQAQSIDQARPNDHAQFDQARPNDHAQFDQERSNDQAQPSDQMRSTDQAQSINQTQIIDQGRPIVQARFDQARSNDKARPSDQARTNDQARPSDQARTKDQARPSDQARLDQARLDQALFDQARLDQARLDQARLDQVRMEQARLDQARLEQARLEQARLDHIRLDWARLEQARSDQARLEQARFDQARSIDPKQFDQARYFDQRRSIDQSRSIDLTRSIDRQKSKSNSSIDMRPKIKHNDLKNQVQAPVTGTESIPLQHEKSFFDKFWGDNSDHKKGDNSENSSNSCVSCALKKIASSEYVCVGCLIVLFVVSIVIALMCVFCKNGPAIVATEEYWGGDSDLLKKRIEKVKEGNRRDGPRDSSSGSQGHWRDSLLHLSGLTGDAELLGPGLDISNIVDASETRFPGLNSIMDTDKTSEFQNSEKLREFYRKLLQADAQIQNLKKNAGASIDDIVLNQHRRKRSLKGHHRLKHFIIRQRKLSKEKTGNRTEFMYPHKRRRLISRYKRNGTYSEKPVGIVIEKKKLLIQYKPLKKVPKCSHAPKNTHTHEKHLKHPFYKNTQKLDELLDIFLTRNLPEVIADPFGFDTLFNQRKDKSKCKHPNIKVYHTEKTPQKTKGNINNLKDKKLSAVTKASHAVPNFKSSDINKLMRPESTTGLLGYDSRKINMNVFGILKNNKASSTTPKYELEMSVSTVINMDGKKIDKTSGQSLLERVPNIRRLMQLNGEEDEFGYEDLKEVISDDIESQNDDESSNIGIGRKKRTEATATPQNTPQTMEEYKHINPPTLNNPNWKGPMPLYPDELSTMVKSGSDDEQLEFPKISKDISAEINVPDIEMSELESYQEYLEKKYDNLGVAQMAQAYSDYGVLDSKKESEKVDKHAVVNTQNQRVKLSVTAPSDKNTITPHAEGLRFEILPETSKTKLDTLDLSQMMDDHIKMGNFLKHKTGLGKYVNDYNYSAKKSKPEGFVFTKVLQDHIKIVDDTKLRDHKNVDKTKSRIVPTQRYDWSAGLILKPEHKRSLLSIDSKTDTAYNGGNELSLSVDDTKNIQAMRITTNNLPSKLLLDNGMHGNGSNILYPTMHEGFNKKTNVKEKLNNYVSNLERFKIKNISEVNLGNGFKTNANIKRDEIDSDIDDYLEMYSIPMTVYFNDEFDNLSKDQDQKYDIDTSTENDFNNKKIDDRIKASTWFKREIKKITSTSKDMKADIKHDDDMLPFNKTEDKTLKINIIHENINDTRLNDFMTAIASFFAFLDSAKANYTQNKCGSELKLQKQEKGSISRNSTCYNQSLEAVSPIDMKHVHNDKLFTKYMDVTTSSIKNLKDGRSAILAVVNNNLGNRTFGGLVRKDKSIHNKTNVVISDLETIKKVGHRSRTLLSLADENIGNHSDINVVHEDAFMQNNTEIVTSNYELENTTTIIQNSTHSTTNGSKERHTNITKNAAHKHENKIMNKTIVKRNADDSNLIFWNDIYDDEYGVEQDRLDDTLRDKHSLKDNSFIRKSGRWVQDKFKKFADNMRRSTNNSSVLPQDKRVSREVITPTRKKIFPKYIFSNLFNRKLKRQAQNSDEDEQDSQKSAFAALTEKMKKVCKQAADAVQQTNVNSVSSVKDNSKQETVTTTLMQQLVKLMNDLVDYEVQQKTCSKLPPDLQSFLDWLTAPDDVSAKQPDGAAFGSFPEYNLFGTAQGSHTTTFNAKPSINKFTTPKTSHMEDQSQYLKVLKEVEGLMEQFRGMSDEDKSKMIGVESYLQNQLNFLKKQLYGYSDYGTSYNFESGRYRRDLSKAKRHKQHKKLHKYIKNFGKKHTSTTVGVIDGNLSSEVKKEPVKEKSKNDGKINKEPKDNNIKRNLQDVYYRALADAKRYTTARVPMQTNVAEKHSTRSNLKKPKDT